MIGTNIAGIPELLQSQCLFKKGSSDEILKAIERILDCDIVKIARENFEKAKEYEREKLVLKRQRFYDAFLEKINNK